MKKLLVSLKNVNHSYKDEKNILQNISLDIFEGDMISLIGLNGSGKTTLLKIIAGLQRPSNGEITRNTENIAYIPQYHDIDISFAISVSELGKLFGGINFKDILNKVDAKNLINYPLSSLSGGQMQRIMIAIALSKEPDLLLLDEPISGVDVAGEKSFYNLIEDIRKTYNVAIILVSHDIHLVFKKTEKIVCLAHHICCKGKPDEVSKSEDFQKAFGPYLKPYVHHHNHTHL